MKENVEFFIIKLEKEDDGIKCFKEEDNIKIDKLITIHCNDYQFTN